MSGLGGTVQRVPGFQVSSGMRWLKGIWDGLGGGEEAQVWDERNPELVLVFNRDGVLEYWDGVDVVSHTVGKLGDVERYMLKYFGNRKFVLRLRVVGGGRVGAAHRVLGGVSCG